MKSPLLKAPTLQLHEDSTSNNVHGPLTWSWTELWLLIKSYNKKENQVLLMLRSWMKKWQWPQHILELNSPKALKAAEENKYSGGCWVLWIWVYLKPKHWEWCPKNKSLCCLTVATSSKLLIALNSHSMNRKWGHGTFRWKSTGLENWKDWEDLIWKCLFNSLTLL